MIWLVCGRVRCRQFTVRMLDLGLARLSVRLSADELNTLKRIAAQEGLTLPSAMREGFLRHAEHCE
jgi:hypothetical protein